MVKVTTDRLRSADITKTKLVDCAVQVVVKTANKSVNAHQEFANFRHDWKERGWFMLDNLANFGNPNRLASCYTRLIILAETYAKKAAELENALIERYRFGYKFYYSKDSQGRFYQTEQDKVIEDRISSYINYMEEFMRVHNAKRALTFQ